MQVEKANVVNNDDCTALYLVALVQYCGTTQNNHANHGFAPLSVLMPSQDIMDPY